MNKDAYWFPHDSTAHGDPKIKRLLRTSGWEGYGVYWALVELLRNENEAGYMIPVDSIDDLCYTMRIKKETVDSVFDAKLLQKNDELFWSQSLIDRMATWDEKRKRRAEAGRKGGKAKAKAKLKQKSSNAKAKVEHCSSKKRTEENRREQKRTEDNPQAEKLAVSLFESLIALKPDRRDVKKTSIPKWAADIEKINRIDGRDWGRIDGLLRWLFNSYHPSNSFDWRDNIKSGEKLRIQFDQLEIAMRKPTPIRRMSQSEKNEEVLDRMRRGEV